MFVGPAQGAVAAPLGGACSGSGGGGGGPRAAVPLVVDTGATATLVDWEGARAVTGLERFGPTADGVVALGGATTQAVGADGVALSLTHRVSTASLALGAPANELLGGGASLDVDVGDLPVVAAFRGAAAGGGGAGGAATGADGAAAVAGILGTDVLLRGGRTLRFDFRAAKLVVLEKA